jgi:hypothetical protein
MIYFLLILGILALTTSLVLQWVGVAPKCKLPWMRRHPKRITLCGSTRFTSAYQYWNQRLTLDETALVYSVSTYKYDNPTERNKQKLDRIHKEKIRASDEIFVLDVSGYIGDSTRSEIAYAKRHGKGVRYLSKEFPSWVEPLSSIVDRLTDARRTALLAINEERRYQDHKWGTLDVHYHSMTEWLDILQRLLQEAQDPGRKSIHNILEITAVGCAILEQFGPPPPRPVAFRPLSESELADLKNNLSKAPRGKAIIAGDIEDDFWIQYDKDPMPSNFQSDDETVKN